MTLRHPASHGRADATQAEFVEWLASNEHLVQELHLVGDGCPDLLVGTTWGEFVVVEAKTRTGRLTVKQKLWHWKWRRFPRCMPKSVTELRAWMEKRKREYERRRAA